MKKLMCMILTVCMLFALAACGETKPADATALMKKVYILIKKSLKKRKPDVTHLPAKSPIPKLPCPAMI